MSEFVNWHIDKMMDKAKQALEAHNFLIELCKNGDEAREKALKELDKESSIGIGGSMTVREIGLFDHLKDNGYNIVNPYLPDLNSEQVFELRRKTLMSDFFLAGCNAITTEGEIVNIDGYGNRVSAIIFGPRKVFLFAGMNKIMMDRQQAIDRVFDVAAPINAKRLKRQTPCAEDGFCTDCDAEQRICKHLTINMLQNIPDRIKIFLIKDNFGF
ncbi:MAG: lactate utilization protein [Candidatus Cloacimonetes bacterium]|nr:lactate utilization protein [Candidatus Cloacimonadota bacterium]